tara:strand:+ start:99 stop:467 length:369 start_codon:yes stop_codon:yes gene_type:complete
MIDYSTFPKRMKEGYEKRGAREGLTGEQYFIRLQKDTAIYKRSLFETKTRKEIYDYLGDILSELTDIADYLEIIDSPYAKRANGIEGDFRNFACVFGVIGESEREQGWDWEEIDFCGRKINK